MPEAAAPRLATSYAANVTLVVLTLFPGLINTSAIALAAPVIGADLGAAPGAAAGIPLASDAALAFGCVLGAELTRRIARRTLFFWLLGLTIATSLTSAVTPSFPLMLAANAVHGLAAGVLFIVVLPPLLTNFKSDKLGATASVMVPALFGAVTLGPLIGGAVASPGAWRIIFALEVAVAIAAVVLARSVLERKDPVGADQPVDWTVLGGAALGSALLFAGAGVLAGEEWRDPLGSIPFVAGLLVYVALLAAEATKEHPLVPVRKLATSLALVGAIATVLGSAAFSALTQCFSLTLLRVDGLGPHAVGLAFWPEFLTAIAGGYAFGRVVTSKWVVLTGAAGLACIGIAAALARAVGPGDAGSVGWLSLIGGFGAGLSVSPGLFIVALSFERALIGRAIALLNLFRLTGGFVSAPGIEHTIGSRAQVHLYVLDPVLPSPLADAAVGAFITGRPLPPIAPVAMMRHALSLAIGDAYLIVLSLALAGIVAIAALLIATHVRLRAPDLARFDDGKPALDAPPLV